MYGSQVRSEEIKEQSAELSKAKNCMTKLIINKRKRIYDNFITFKNLSKYTSQNYHTQVTMLKIIFNLHKILHQHNFS